MRLKLEGDPVHPHDGLVRWPDPVRVTCTHLPGVLLQYHGVTGPVRARSRRQCGAPKTSVVRQARALCAPREPTFRGIHGSPCELDARWAGIVRGLLAPRLDRTQPSAFAPFSPPRSTGRAPLAPGGFSIHGRAIDRACARPSGSCSGSACPTSTMEPAAAALVLRPGPGVVPGPAASAQHGAVNNHRIGWRGGERSAAPPLACPGDARLGGSGGAPAVGVPGFGPGAALRPRAGSASAAPCSPPPPPPPPTRRFLRG